MTTQNESVAGSGLVISKMQVWVGHVMSGLASLFLLVDGMLKLLKPAAVVRATLLLGYAESAILGIGATLLACTLLYVMPRTSTLGALLLTAYLGGAVASNIRAGMPLFNVLFPMIIAGLVWGGLGRKRYFCMWPVYHPLAGFEDTLRDHNQPAALYVAIPGILDLGEPNPLGLHAEFAARCVVHHLVERIGEHVPRRNARYRNEKVRVELRKESHALSSLYTSAASAPVCRCYLVV